VFERDGTCLDDIDIETLKVVAGPHIVSQVLTAGEQWRENNDMVMPIVMPIAYTVNCFSLIALQIN
jgi:hypothetical protein